MIDKRSYILLTIGLAGLISFFLLRPYIDFFASGSISESKVTVEDRIETLAPALGFSTDSLAMISMRRQHHKYLSEIIDTTDEELFPFELNQKGVHLQSWETVIGEVGEAENYYASSEDVFEDLGRLKVHTADAGRIIRLEAHSENSNPTFVQGDSLLSIAKYIVQDVLGYELDNYQLSDNDLSDSPEELPNDNGSLQSFNENNSFQSLEISWKKKSDNVSLPDELSLNLTPIVREINNQDGFRTEFGFSIKSFVAKHELEPVNLQTGDTGLEDENIVVTFLLFGCIFVLVVSIVIIGIRNIFKGKVEWRRALFVFTVISLGIFGWRAIFFIDSFNPFLSNPSIFIANINNFINGLVAGLYVAMAYISWEALARSHKQNQLDVIDSLWQGKFFVRETGAGVVHGFAFGGIVIGIISSLVFFMGEFLVQADSQFGFAEPGITLKLLTMNMNAWTTTWLVTIAQFGFVYAILNHWIKRDWLVGILAILLSGIFITVIGRLIGTTGTVFQDIIIYMGIAVVFVYAIREFGLLTVTTGWWVFTVFFMMLPYWNSPAIDVAYVGWVQAFVLAGPLIYGFIAYRYGISVSEVGDYIPEYEERIAQHLRVEKEIEIARESQYKLMPLQPPKGDGFDVYGFFLPSFEVGGDYFDYLLTENEDGKPTALTMAVVDVSGKAMRAAMPAVFTSGLLLSRMKHDCPDEVLSEISDPIFLRTDKRTFITCVLARYDLESMKMNIANAGHCRPVLKRDGIAEYIHTPEPAYPLGMMKGVKYKTEEIAIKKGDFFLLYSDGLPEAINEKGERFGFDQVPRLVESIDTDNLTAHEIAQEIKRTVQKFSNYQLADDTTIICLKI